MYLRFPGSVSLAKIDNLHLHDTPGGTYYPAAEAAGDTSIEFKLQRSVNTASDSVARDI